MRRRTGVLTETPSLYESLSARENLRFFGDLYGVAEEALPGRVDALLEEFGLADRADDRAGTYSKGMRQRLALARTLLHEPRILFLDEPTAGLDPAASRMVNDLIQRLAAQGGHTIFLCTHNLAEAQRLCDRIGVIDRGTLRAVGARRRWPAGSADRGGGDRPARRGAARRPPRPRGLAAVRASAKESGASAWSWPARRTSRWWPRWSAPGPHLRGGPAGALLEDIYFQIQEQTALREHEPQLRAIRAILRGTCARSCRTRWFSLPMVLCPRCSSWSSPWPW